MAEPKEERLFTPSTDRQVVPGKVKPLGVKVVVLKGFVFRRPFHPRVHPPPSGSLSVCFHGTRPGRRSDHLSRDPKVRVWSRKDLGVGPALFDSLSTETQGPSTPSPFHPPSLPPSLVSSLSSSHTSLSLSVLLLVPLPSSVRTFPLFSTPSPDAPLRLGPCDGRPLQSTPRPSRLRHSSVGPCLEPCGNENGRKSDFVTDRCFVFVVNERIVLRLGNNPLGEE